MSLKTTDRYLAPGVYVSSQVYYQAKNRDYLRAKASLIHRAVDILKQVMDFNDNVQVRIASIKNRLIGGYYDDKFNIATVRIRPNFKSMLETLAHELVHGEQFHTGKLEYKWVKYDWCYRWENTEGKLNSTLSGYMKAQHPWEQEAFGRQEALASLVYLKLMEQIDQLSDIEKKVLK